MNTIPEMPNGTQTETIITTANVTTSTSSINNGATSTGTATQANGSPRSKDEASQIGDTNNGDCGPHSRTALNGDCTSDLKILEHLRNIEEINEKRRFFLANTIAGAVNEQTESSSTLNRATITTENGSRSQKEILQEFTEKRLKVLEHAEKSVGTFSVSPSSSEAVLRSPTSPPPKPPMLSRTRSMGTGERGSLTSPPNTPLLSHSAPLSPSEPHHQSTPHAITKTKITCATIPEPVQVTSVQLRDEPAAGVRRPERPQSLPDTPKQISSNHYERLIEELKCPGCAYPMKAPVLLCQTGHSVCEQCTRILMVCPLCREPFTNIRSLTVEALCSKAHFRCTYAAGGCTVRLQIELLGWHEKQCIYKPMRCFMGRVWGDCQWTGREAQWKEHLEGAHANRVFKKDTIELVWNMSGKQKPLNGYYVFEVFEEMFNFYEVYDKERVLFTMTCTSTVKEKKYNYAFEVTVQHPDNEALAITQKFPVHSEYDNDILLDGTCVSVALADLAKFLDKNKLLHYRVRLLKVKSPRKARNSCSQSNGVHPIDFQQTQIEGVNLKNVPQENIVTRRLNSIPGGGTSRSPSSNGADVSDLITSEDEMEKIRKRYSTRNEDSCSESDPEFEAFIAKKWGTPQLHFNRKYLKSVHSESSSNEEQSRNGDHRRLTADDRMSMASTNTSYKKKMTNSLRKSFRNFKSDFIELRPFRKSPEKNGK